MSTGHEAESEAGVDAAGQPHGEEEDGRFDVVGRHDEHDVVGPQSATLQRRRHAGHGVDQLIVRHRLASRQVRLPSKIPIAGEFERTVSAPPHIDHAVVGWSHW